jgi:hypothetical protein
VKCKKRQRDRRKLGPLDVVAVGEIGCKCNAEEHKQKQKPGRVGLDRQLPGSLSIDVWIMGEVRCERRGSNTVLAKTSPVGPRRYVALTRATTSRVPRLSVYRICRFICAQQQILNKQRVTAAWAVAEITNGEGKV